MNAKPDSEQSMQEEQVREALNTHWHASAAGDANVEHDIYHDDAMCDYPQSGERIFAKTDWTCALLARFGWRRKLKGLARLAKACASASPATWIGCCVSMSRAMHT